MHPDEFEEFAPGGHVILETPEDGGGHHLAVLLFDPAHHHAEVLALDDHTHTLGVDGFHEGLGDLAGEALLDLEAPGEAIDEAGEFADPVDLVPGDVADMAFPEEGEHVVFAHAVDLYVADDDHVIAFFGEDCLPKNIMGIDAVALREVIPGFFDAAGGVDETLPGGVLADAGQDVGNGFLHGFLSG